MLRIDKIEPRQRERARERGRERERHEGKIEREENIERTKIEVERE